MDILKELVDLSVGALALTKERAEKVVKNLIRKGKLGEKEGKSLVKELIQKGKKERETLNKELAKAVKDVVGKLNLATKDELDRLKREVAGLKKHKH
ncbi:MAG TPA: hypothetical protein DCL35_03340 [Candidatus Omnitrophica bacterium]|nr:hypothetical protein [Candidatus Omnitrophota bacterium]